MKNGLIIWNVILSLVAGYLLVTHFISSGKNSNAGSKWSSNDTSGVNKNFKIAYFEMDSVANNFSLVKELKSELSKKEDGIALEMERLAKNLQQKYKYFQDQAQAGTLTQEQSESAGQELKKLDDDMKIRKQQLEQDYFDFKTRRENEVKTKIEDFVKEYNKKRSYTYIMSYEPGLFYYRDTTYNITADVIKGLNSSFPPGKK